MYWYENDGDKDPIILSTRVRFARNLKSLPFPACADRESRKKVCEAAAESFSDLSRYDFTKLSDIEKNAYVETHLCSPQFAGESGEGKELYVSEDHQISVMVNEEDHFRIQAICSGFVPRKAFELANLADEKLIRSQPIAFSDKLGFLTACPTNLGCAMRISAMLHLPALKAAGEIPGLVRATDRLGFTLRGAFGEGSEAQGDLYQISNKSSFEHSEEEILAAFEKVIAQISQSEKARREQLIQQNRAPWEDKIFRSLGILSQARIMSYTEFVARWSDLRLGEALGLLHFADKSLLDRLLVELMPARLCLEDMSAADPERRDILRAEKLRAALKQE